MEANQDVVSQTLTPIGLQAVSRIHVFCVRVVLGEVGPCPRNRIWNALVGGWEKAFVAAVPRR